jgi:signal transduction histidine kinase
MNAETPVQSGFAPFLPRARLLRLIGSELISDDVVAVTELVKNAHDADASFVSLQFVSVTGGEGEIIVRDDGRGMDLATLLTRWMQPAGSAKGREGTRFTLAGRRVLGEKGVGRFATDKLASRLELASRCEGEPSEIHAVFDWDDFESDDRMLSEIRSRWEVRPADWLDSRGTMLRLMHLRSSWNERMFRRLCTRLARLVSPFEAVKNFRVLIESDDFPQYAGEIGGGYLDVAPYRIEAEFDGVEMLTVRVNDGRQARHSLSGQESLRCGPVKARLFGFDLETDALAKLGPRAEVRAWLREWSGISVYRDGFRVWPYGEPHDDWLRLDQRRVNNPVVRLSNNQVVGFVEISSDRNPDLRDQTNREGLIHNDALEGLQRLVLLSLQVLEAERQAARHPQARRPAGRGPGSRATREAASVPDHLDALAARADVKLAGDLRRAADRVRSAASAEASSRRKMLEGYTELAAAGQTVSLVARSVAACLGHVQTVCSTLRGSLGSKDFGSLISSAGALHQLEGTVEIAISQLRAATSVQGGASKRRRGLDVATELESLRKFSLPLLEDENAVLVVDAARGAVLRTEMRPELFSAVMSSLLMNALQWRHPDRALRITTQVRLAGDGLEILLSDNGRGVLPGLELTIFEPMVSGRPEGPGMGLTIARSVIEEHGGQIELVMDRRRRGAAFRIRLPRKRSRATITSRVPVRT